LISGTLKALNDGDDEHVLDYQEHEHSTNTYWQTSNEQESDVGI